MLDPATAQNVPEPKGADVLRELDVPAVPRDEIEALRRRREVIQEFEQASLRRFEDFLRRTVRRFVFEGCASLLLLVLVFLLCVIWALR